MLERPTQLFVQDQLANGVCDWDRHWDDELVQALYRSQPMPIGTLLGRDVDIHVLRDVGIKMGDVLGLDPKTFTLRPDVFAPVLLDYMAAANSDFANDELFLTVRDRSLHGDVERHGSKPSKHGWIRFDMRMLGDASPDLSAHIRTELTHAKINLPGPDWVYNAGVAIAAIFNQGPKRWVGNIKDDHIGDARDAARAMMGADGIRPELGTGLAKAVDLPADSGLIPSHDVAREEMLRALSEVVTATVDVRYFMTKLGPMTTVTAKGVVTRPILPF